MAKIGDVEVTVTNEQIDRGNDVTDRKVESGSISDNVKAEPDVINLTGVVGKDGWPKLQQLKKYDDSATLLKYSGRNVYHNVVIANLDTNHPYSARTGFTFTCVLKQIKITKSRAATINVPKAVKPQVKPKTNAGSRVPTSKPRKSGGSASGGRKPSGSTGGSVGGRGIASTKNANAPYRKTKVPVTNFMTSEQIRNFPKGQTFEKYSPTKHGFNIFK